MSMPRMPQGRGEVGEAVAGFPTYEGAQKAVSALIAGDVPARDIAIVGIGLRSVERVTGRLGYATAARSGAINGLLLGLFFSAIFVLGNSAVPVSAFIGVLFLGVALGMLMSIGAYAIVRRRRDFASVMQVIADHYDVTVMPESIHRAREVLGAGTAAGAPHAHAAAPPPVPQAPPVDAPPPRYGERVQPARPAYGELAPQPAPEPAPEDAAPEGAASGPHDAAPEGAASGPHDAAPQAGPAPQTGPTSGDAASSDQDADGAPPADADAGDQHRAH